MHSNLSCYQLLAFLFSFTYQIGIAVAEFTFLLFIRYMHLCHYHLKPSPWLVK